MSPQCFGSVAWYRAMSAFPRVVIDTGIAYDKRFKSIHRYSIADVRGALTLTVPVGHPLPGGSRKWSRTLVSDHGHWPHVHLTTLESAYGRTPYFEFYIDRIAPLLTYSEISVTDFCMRADEVIRDILGLPTVVLTPDAFTASDATDFIAGGRAGVTDDLRSRESIATFAPAPYRQHRIRELGFIPGLSILDLIFNLGPEAPLSLL